jgi:hypothetical protein
MTTYRESEDKVDWAPTKWDGFKIEATGKPYKTQKGSGRHAVFALIKVGMTVGDWAKAAAAKGFDSKFTVGSLLKHQEGDTAAYRLSKVDANGRNFDQVKKIRQSDPEKQAKREAKAKAKAEAKAKNAAAREAKAKEKATAREAKAKEKAAKKSAKGATA